MNNIDKINFVENKDRSIKKGADLVFQLNPELNTVGSCEQYSKYLETIFPQSEIKKILWHAAFEKFNKFDCSLIGKNTNKKIIDYYGNGFYFSYEDNVGERWNRPHTIPAVVNYISDDESNNNYNASTYVVIENPDNIHILGTKEDIEDFHKFITQI